MPDVVTVVISAAGMGTRLGLNIPKALVNVAGRPILCWQLDALSNIEDIVVVAGYKSELVIDLLRKERPDVRVALNHDFSSTGTAASVSHGANASGDWVVSLDGDLLVRERDLSAFLSTPSACLGITPSRSAKPVWAQRSQEGYITELCQTKVSSWEWSGLAKIPRATALSLGRGHVFSGLRNALPMTAIEIDCVEIDDPDDLILAEQWIRM